jgi:hypothetical protein
MVRLPFCLFLIFNFLCFAIVAALDPTKYPTMDQVPPINSTEVQQWIEEVKNSAYTVPGISVTNGV